MLTYNLKKIAYMVARAEKNKEMMESELEQNPLILCGQKMMRENEYTYLGTVISGKGVAESASESVRNKLGKVKHLIFEIKTVVENCKNNSPGSFMTGLLIWESAIIPYLYHAAECWVEVSKKTLLALNSLTETFLRAMLACPKSTPIVSLYWEVAMLLPENRVLQYKLLFYHHITNLGEDTLAFKIQQQQRKLRLPGLVQECLVALASLGIDEEKVRKMNKYQWKDLIKKRLQKKNSEEILEKMRKSKKFDFLSHKDENFETKSYFKTMTLQESRTMFSLRSQTTKTIKTHQMSNKSFASKLWKCSCGSIDSISHIKRCVNFKGLRDILDIEHNENDLVKYFQEVIKIRNEAPDE